MYQAAEETQCEEVKQDEPSWKDKLLHGMYYQQIVELANTNKF